MMSDTNDKREPLLSNSKTLVLQAAKKPEMAAKTLEEADVGILCYVSDLPGFHGILKQRYADFIVNEVDCDGNVVHLTCLDAPPEVKVKNEVKKADQHDKSYASEIELFRCLAGESDAEQLKALIHRINSGAEDSVEPIVLSSDSDKAHRTEVHKFFKENFEFLVTDTIDGHDASSKCIRVRFNSRSSNIKRSKKRKERHDKPFDSRGADCWPEDTGKFLRFHLCKENKDTQEALGVIGKMLGLQPRSFGFAGTKDKRSVSTQRVTVFKQHASRLAALNDRLIGIKVGDFCYVKDGLLLGQLLGNRFTISLRGVVADSEDTIRASVDALGKHGYINYFGLQRFGSGSVPTHLVGATLLRGEWKDAVSMILDPREGEKDAIRKAREYFKESGDIEGTLRKLPRNMIAERAVLQSLKICPGNYLQALKAIPRTLRMMYVHSYQSYLWNHATSMRVQRYGIDQVVLGDLVYSKGYCCQKMTELISESEDSNYNCFDDWSHQKSGSEIDISEDRNFLVKAVDAEDLASGSYTIDDVVLPLPGAKVIYPTNDITGIYHDLAKKDAISLTKSTHTVKEFSITNMAGGYRRVFQKPADFEWELLTYTDGNMPLAETDLDKISKPQPVNISHELDPLKDNKDDNKPVRELALPPQAENPSAQEGSGTDAQRAQLAVKMSFTLPTSSYATMAIRELLKTSTSVAFHKLLN